MYRRSRIRLPPNPATAGYSRERQGNPATGRPLHFLPLKRRTTTVQEIRERSECRRFNFGKHIFFNSG
ncbi:hypothetical protein BHK98_10350 [Hornefia porci]|uniref:Uncharacterized protein n=1 Tax=Hornefia porci TaxID=2652292 RepID=A0A1Q9JJS9_9FIRM|nr:hypothetical protein BHK98_10350 [Hornefia porci]